MAIKGSGSPMEAVDEYFDMLIKSRFNEMFGDPISNPHKWIKKKMKDVLVIERGGSPRPIDDYLTDDENGLNWIKIGDATEGSYFIDSVKEKIKPEGLKKTRQVYPGDLILSNSMSFGKPYILNISGCIHDGWLVLHDKDDAFNKMFLCFTLSHNSIKEAFKNMARGGVVNNLNKDLVGSLDIIIPPKEIQYDFVHFLLEVDKTKAIYKRIFESFDNLVKSRFIEMFGGCKEKVPIGNICTLHSRIGWQALTKAEHMSSGDYMLITGTDFKDGQIDYSGSKFVSKERYEMDPNIIIQNGDVLVTKDGTIGKVAVVRDLPKPATLNAGIFVVRNRDDQFLTEFLQQCLLSTDFQRFIESVKRGATIVHLNQEKFLKYEIPVADPELQKQFVSFVQQVDKSKFEVVQSLLRLKSKYMRTETPSERTD